MPPHHRPSLLRDHLQSPQLHQLDCWQSDPRSMQLQSYLRIGQAQLPAEAVICRRRTSPRKLWVARFIFERCHVQKCSSDASRQDEKYTRRGPQDDLREWEPHNSAQDWCKPVEASDYNRHYMDRQTLLAEHKSLPSRSNSLIMNCLQTHLNIHKKWISNDNFHSHFIYHHPTFIVE